MLREHARKRLTKKAKKGFRGFPVATVAFYGPDNRRASKLTVGIVLAENQEAVELKQWFAEQGGMTVGDSPEARCAHFESQLRSGNVRDQIIEEYPVLARSIVTHRWRSPSRSANTS